MKKVNAYSGFIRIKELLEKMRLMMKNEQHLSFIQNNISRMNQCSFQMKGWAITTVTALLTIFTMTLNAEGEGNNLYIFIAVVPTLLFWCLDSYYLSIERKFVDMYNDVINESSNMVINEYEMPLKKYKGWKYCFIKLMFSTTEMVLYGIIIGALILLGIFV